MAWDFETEPEFQEKLDWMDAFVTREIEPLDLAFREPGAAYDRRNPMYKEITDPLKAAVKAKGLWACHLGPDLGGPGFGQLKLALMNEVLGRSNWAPNVFGCQAPDSGNAEILAHYGTPEQKQRYLQPLLDGDIVSCFSMTEPQAGADPKEFKCRATRDGDQWVINGDKYFSSHADLAEFLIVMVITNPDVPVHQGASMFLVPRDTPGLTIARCNETLGCRFMNNGELVFEDMRVPEDHLLAENDALGRAGVYFQPGKIIQAAKNLGVGVRAFEVTSDYVQNYVQGGRILIKHQAVALRLADMATKLEATRALLERAAAAVDAKAPDADALCNMAKLFASEEILKVATHAVELHGGNGMMLDFGVEKLFRDAAIFPHMDGTTDISRFKIVKALFPDTAGKYAGPEA